MSDVETHSDPIARFIARHYDNMTPEMQEDAIRMIDEYDEENIKFREQVTRIQNRLDDLRIEMIYHQFDAEATRREMLMLQKENERLRKQR